MQPGANIANFPHTNLRTPRDAGSITAPSSTMLGSSNGKILGRKNLYFLSSKVEPASDKGETLDRYHQEVPLSEGAY